MLGIRLAFVVFSLIAGTSSSSVAPQQPNFATCSWWRGLDAETHRLYRLGFAQGVVVGATSGVRPVAPAQTDAENALAEMHSNGLIAVLQKPSLMEEAFNVKCGDYRNSQVLLSGLATIAMLEIGGLSAERAEAGLQVYRVERIPSRVKIIGALIGAKRP